MNHCANLISDLVSWMFVKGRDILKYGSHESYRTGTQSMRRESKWNVNRKGGVKDLSRASTADRLTETAKGRTSPNSDLPEWRWIFGALEGVLEIGALS